LSRTQKNNRHKHKKPINEDDNMAPKRNIFKMSRQMTLIDKSKNKNLKKMGQKQKTKDKELTADGVDMDDTRESVNSDVEYNYSESSDDSDQGDKKDNEGKKLVKEFKLVEITFPSTMIKAQGKNRLQWDLLIIVLSIYQAISIPISISFKPDEFNSPYFKTLDSIIDLIFIVDIIFRFRTTYIDPVSGEEVTDSYMISKRYIQSSTFYTDVLSTIPLDDFFGDGLILQLFGLLKLLRVQRISSVILNLNTSQEVKAGLKVIYLVFQMFLYIHVMGCIWYFVVSIEESWIPNLDFIWFGSAQVYDVYYTEISRSYWTSFYIGFYLFGVGEVCPRTETEILVAIPILILSSIMNGLIIGNMALYISELNKKGAEFQRKMDTVNTAMNNLNLS
jgi:hypothetical protein